MKTTRLTAMFFIIFTGVTLLFANNKDTTCKELGKTLPAPTNLVIGLAQKRVELPLMMLELAPAKPADLKLKRYR